jgi:hypothetical protein
MDKKVTSTFHCVASRQVLKALRERGQPKPSTRLPETGARQRVAFLWTLRPSIPATHQAVQAGGPDLMDLDAVRYLTDDLPQGAAP